MLKTIKSKGHKILTEFLPIERAGAAAEETAEEALLGRFGHVAR